MILETLNSNVTKRYQESSVIQFVIHTITNYQFQSVEFALNIILDDRQIPDEGHSYCRERLRIVQ